MPAIPSNINGVLVDFSPNANRNVDQKIINALKLVVKPKIASDYQLKRIYISSANDQHTLPSRHVQGDGKAVDISRINSNKMATHYNSDEAVEEITKAMQDAFEDYPHRRENFGPAFKKKSGEAYSVSGHGDHIHFSVN